MLTVGEMSELNRFYDCVEAGFRFVHSSYGSTDKSNAITHQVIRRANEYTLFLWLHHLSRATILEVKGNQCSLGDKVEDVAVQIIRNLDDHINERRNANEIV